MPCMNAPRRKVGAVGAGSRVWSSGSEAGRGGVIGSLMTQNF